MPIGSSRSLGGGVSYKAGGTIHIARFVKLDSTAFQILECTSGNAVLGVMQEGMRDPPGSSSTVDATIAAISGDKGRFHIYQDGDKCRVWLIAAVTAGQAIKASTDGKAIAHTSGAANIGGFALTDGAADELIEMLVAPGTFTPA